MPSRASSISPTASQLNPDQTILEVARTAGAAGLDLNQALLLAAEKIRLMLGVTLVSFFLPQSPVQIPLLKVFSGHEGPKLLEPGFSLPADASADLDTCLKKSKTLRLNKVNLSEKDPRAGLATAPLFGALLPLSNAEGSFAVIELLAEDVNLFSVSGMEFYQSLTNQLSPIIHNCLRHGIIKKKLERYDRLQQLLTGAGQFPVAVELINRAVQTLSGFFPGSRVTYLTPESRGNLRVRAYAGYTADDSRTLQFKSHGGAAGQAAGEQKTQLVADTRAAKALQGLLTDSRSILAVPVQNIENVFGILNLEDPSPDAFSTDDVEIVTFLAHNLASVLASQALVDQIGQYKEKQNQLYEAVNNIRKSTDVEGILRASAEEIGTLLNLHKVTLRLTAPQTEPADSSSLTEQVQ